MARTATPLVLELQRATQAVGLRLEAELADLDLSQGEAHVLAVLDASGPSTVGELQRSLQVRASTLSGILDRLEGRGLLVRDLNPDDRRSLLVSLTKAGQRAAARVIAVLGRIESEVLASNGAAKVAGFRAVARALAEPEE